MARHSGSVFDFSLFIRRVRNISFPWRLQGEEPGICLSFGVREGGNHEGLEPGKLEKQIPREFSMEVTCSDSTGIIRR